MFPAGVDTLAANLRGACNHPRLAVVLPRALNSWHFPTGLSGITSSQQNARHQNNISVHSGVLLFQMLIRSQDDKLNGPVTRECDFLRSLRSEKVVWASKTADKALANSEVTCELSLPPEHKSWSGRRKRWHLPNVPWVQPEAHSCKPAPGEGRGRARERKGGLLSPTNQTVTKSELTTQKGEEQMPRGGGGRDGGHSKPGYPWDIRCFHKECDRRKQWLFLTQVCWWKSPSPDSGNRTMGSTHPSNPPNFTVDERISRWVCWGNKG